MGETIVIRPVQKSDFEAWKPLWDGYNAFYGRHGETALPEEGLCARGRDSSIPMSR